MDVYVVIGIYVKTEFFFNMNIYDTIERDFSQENYKNTTIFKNFHLYQNLPSIQNMFYPVKILSLCELVILS